MKKLINNPILYFILILVGIAIMLSMTSCTSSRQSGCAITRGMIGYR